MDYTIAILFSITTILVINKIIKNKTFERNDIADYVILSLLISNLSANKYIELYVQITSLFIWAFGLIVIKKLKVVNKV